MGLLQWLEKKYTKKFETTWERINQMSNSVISNYQFYYKRKYFHYSSEIETKIANEFLDHDGYFSKLMIDNKLIGYIFRCTYKDVELVTKAGKKRLVPYLVTCVYQPVYNGIKSNYIKTLGKDTALKSGIREIKDYINGTNDLELLGLENKFMNFNTVFPEYSEVKNNENYFGTEFYNMTEEDYNNIKDYIKTFDEKTFKYYSNVAKNDILKIWIKR